MSSNTTDTAATLLALGPRLLRWAERQTDEAAASDHLTWRQLEVLDMVKAWRDPALGTLASKLGVTPAVVTGLVDRLERQHYLRRVRDKRDARVIRVVLTPAGTAASDAAEARLRDRIAEAMGALTAEEQGALAAAMNLLERIGDESCPHCGAGVVRADRFCPSCGRSLAD